MHTIHDVIIVGGGTAGVVAALAAARNGADVLVVERTGNLGGLSAIGMTWGGFFDGNFNQVIRGIPDELVCKSVAKGGGLGYIKSYERDNWISVLASVDPETVRYVMLEELLNTGCQVMLFSSLCAVDMEKERIQSITVFSPQGLSRHSAKVFIDATGDACLADLAGVPWERETGNGRQCETNIFRVGNVDIPFFEAYMEREINVEKREPWLISHAPLRTGIRYWCPWKKENGYSVHFGIYWHGYQGDVLVNTTSVDVDSLDPRQLAVGDLKLRMEIEKLFHYLKNNVDGFRNSYISYVYDIGVRESRRIQGRYRITEENVREGTVFSDVIGMGAYPLDVHESNGDAKIVSHSTKSSSSSYQIPYAALLPLKISNLIVAGRCISATFRAEAALRGIGPCMVEGQASGTAAALAVKSNVEPVDLNILKLQDALLVDGVFLGDKD